MCIWVSIKRPCDPFHLHLLAFWECGVLKILRDLFSGYLLLAFVFPFLHCLCTSFSTSDLWLYQLHARRDRVALVRHYLIGDQVNYFYLSFSWCIFAFSMFAQPLYRSSILPLGFYILECIWFHFWVLELFLNFLSPWRGLCFSHNLR